jgi:hypothetical protein
MDAVHLIWVDSFDGTVIARGVPSGGIALEGLCLQGNSMVTRVGAPLRDFVYYEVSLSNYEYSE